MDARSWQDVKQVIAEVAALPAERRAAFLHARCPDPERRHEIVALLRHFEQMPNLSDVLTTITRRLEEPRAAAAEPLALGTGSRIGPFIVIEKIGAGGMGEVFLGKDTRLRRKVALKCLLASSGDVRSKILREAQVIAQINHPHIATVHDVVEHGGRTFLVMEYVEGESLATRLRRGRLPVERVLAIGRQLASALSAAHATGIIHGDLKPANVQVKPDGSVKVLDFGVAQAVSLVAAESTDSPTLESIQNMLLGGTPAYMSPEQISGRRLDHRSDIYSLGLVLYEMATGSRPYSSGDPVERLIALVKNPRPRADAGGAPIPGSLADVIAKALDIDVNRRYQSALDVEGALEGVQRELESKTAGGRAVWLAWVLRIAAGVLLAIVAVGLLGAISTFAFNITFGRTGPFARFGVEPWRSYFRWGLLGIVPKLLVMTVAALIVMTAGILLRAVALIAPIGRIARSIATGGRRLGLAMGLDRPAMLAQVIAGLGMAALAGFGWRHADLIAAFNASFNSASIDMLLPMRESAPARGLYQAELSVLTLALGFALYKVIQLRRRERTREGRVAVAALAGVLVVSILMNEAPYRSFNHRDFERVDWMGARCYITGQSDDEFLILCPGGDPPRNRTVRRGDPVLHRLGITENVFRGINK